MHQQEELILKHLWLVKQIAKSLALRTGGEQEEFEADGMIGLIEAARRFNAKKSNSFKSFAYQRIRGAMVDGFRKQDALGRYERTQRKKDPKRQEKTDHLIHHRRVRIQEEKIFEELTSKAADQIAYLERRYLRELLNILPPRLQTMMKAHYLEQKTYEEIGKEMGRSMSLVCLMHKKAIEMIREYLKEKGLL